MSSSGMKLDPRWILNEKLLLFHPQFSGQTPWKTDNCKYFIIKPWWPLCHIWRGSSGENTEDHPFKNHIFTKIKKNSLKLHQVAVLTGCHKRQMMCCQSSKLSTLFSLWHGLEFVNRAVRQSMIHNKPLGSIGYKNKFIGSEFWQLTN